MKNKLSVRTERKIQLRDITRQVAQVVGDLEGVRTSHVELTWSPPWTKDRMSDEAMLELGLL